MIVGLLGLQGAFRDHIRHLEKLGVGYRIVKRAVELDKVDRLIIPGGESTVMEKFLNMFAMTAPLKASLEDGLPVWGICAGAILLARTVDGRPGILGVLPVDLTRNAYGRQRESSAKTIAVPVLQRSQFPALFIRAPRIESVGPDVTIHASADNDPVFVQYNHMLATTFHPELTEDPVFHDYFVREI